jgi:hypothetical protein
MSYILYHSICHRVQSAAVFGPNCSRSWQVSRPRRLTPPPTPAYTSACALSLSSFVPLSLNQLVDANRTSNNFANLPFTPFTPSPARSPAIPLRSCTRTEYLHLSARAATILGTGPATRCTTSSSPIPPVPGAPSNAPPRRWEQGEHFSRPNVQGTRIRGHRSQTFGPANSKLLRVYE